MPDGVGVPQFEEEDYNKIGWFQQVFAFIKRRVTIASVSSAYTVATNVFWVRGDATGGAFAVTFPAAADWGGRQICVMKTDASGNAVTATMSGSDKTNGAGTKALAAQYSKAVFISDGASNWDQIA